MNGITSGNKIELNKLAIKNFRAILKRNKENILQLSDSSKSINNISSQNKSEFIKPNTLSLKNRRTRNKNIKIDKITPTKIDNRYSNVNLFTNRISKGMQFFNRMKLKKTKNKTLDLQRDILNLHLNVLTSKRNLLLKEKKLKERDIKFKSIFKEINPKYINPLFLPLRENKMFKNNLSIHFPKIKHKKIIFPESGSKSCDDAYISSKRENEKIKEKEKNIIKENLTNLLYKIKQRILPKRKLIFEKNKLPEIDNINLKRNKSCIHLEKNFLGKIEFLKTHLDGISRQDNSKKNKDKSNKKYEINEGYVNLEYLGEGEKISFKTDLVVENGLIYYAFSKKGGMDTIEEKIHVVKKDKKELKNLFKKYNQIQLLKTLQAKDFQNIKKEYKVDSFLTNKNIYKDLYHLLFKNKTRDIEMKKEIDFEDKDFNK